AGGGARPRPPAPGGHPPGRGAGRGEGPRPPGPPPRRITRRTIRHDWPYSPLSPSQVELLRTVVDHPGIGVRDAAEYLNLAPNTVSTLVGSLTDAGLLERTPHQPDPPAPRLHVPPPP